MQAPCCVRSQQAGHPRPLPSKTCHQSSQRTDWVLKCGQNLAPHTSSRPGEVKGEFPRRRGRLVHEKEQAETQRLANGGKEMVPRKTATSWGLATGAILSASTARLSDHWDRQVPSQTPLLDSPSSDLLALGHHFRVTFSTFSLVLSLQKAPTPHPLRFHRGPVRHTGYKWTTASRELPPGKVRTLWVAAEWVTSAWHHENHPPASVLDTSEQLNLRISCETALKQACFLCTLKLKTEAHRREDICFRTKPRALAF